MGYNATVVVMVDALERLEKDPSFGKHLADGIRTMMTHRPDRVDVGSGGHANAAHVVEVHHADSTSLVTVGGNLGVSHLQTYGWRHTEPALQERMLREWADKLGFDVVARPKSTTQGKQYLLVLSGGGDTVVKLVTQAVWDWVQADYGSAEASYAEPVPPTILDLAQKHGVDGYFKDGMLRVTRGSAVNDRAMFAPGLKFDYLSDVVKYARKHKVSIEETFNGCLY
ncbi:hypothetical protein [Burkholderia ambifaria]|uniref:hypothetical protein n=1 Tax=Burkholderia ambifaria TaxID=152480 RepID=UPI000F80B34F|nr:hypothetical protein [Burkholderia ambifaria]